MMTSSRGVGGVGGSSSSTAITLRERLQSAVQSLQWTYSFFWQLCPQEGVLVWADGYYNGDIRTRRTVEPADVTAEAASLQRGQQLRELFESLSAGEANTLPSRRPCAGLSPEDLTESEWFFLVCVSFTFPPGVGLPGKAFEKQQPVWLSGASEVDSKVFSRAILAKSAQLQTVVCIPLAGGVLEIGTTDKIEEDLSVIEHVKTFFTGHHSHPFHRTKPVLSELSTSKTGTWEGGRRLFRSPSLLTAYPAAVDSHMCNEEDEHDDDSEDGDDGAESCSDSGAGTGSMVGNLASGDAAAAVEPNKPVHTEIREEMMQLGSPDDCSDDSPSEPLMFAVRRTTTGPSDHQHRADMACQAWHLHDDAMSGQAQNNLKSPSSIVGATSLQSSSQTISRTPQDSSSRREGSGGRCRGTAFSSWSCRRDTPLPVQSPQGVSQWLLKCVLLIVPSLQGADEGDTPKPSDGEGGNRFCNGTVAVEEPSANHVLAERRRREKLNERFLVLRSLVPFVTKMDKASILGDTIEYIKQLARRVQDCESQMKQTEEREKRERAGKTFTSGSKEQHVNDVGSPISDAPHHLVSGRSRASSRKKLRLSNGGSASVVKATPVGDANTNVQVSIIEDDALLELQCPNRDGLPLRIMRALFELRLETTAIRTSSANGTFVAEIRAKVKENIHGKRASIVEVQKALCQIFS